jgi:two-component system, OmpR family, response regulator RpaA
MNTINGKAVLTTGQVAEICHVAPRTVSKWFDRGQLPGYRIPGSRDRRIPVEQLMAFMRANNIPLDALEGGICRVLIVDDDVDRGREAERLFADLGGYQVRSASSEFEAGVVAQQLRPHVVILATGNDRDASIGACHRIRAALELPTTRVVAAYPGSREAHHDELLALGFDDCVQMPYHLEGLLRVIESVTSVLT